VCGYKANHLKYARNIIINVLIYFNKCLSGVGIELETGGIKSYLAVDFYISIDLYSFLVYINIISCS